MSIATSAPAWPSVTTPSGTTLSGTTTIIRLILRRDRIRIPVWVAAVAGLVALTVSSVQGLYPTAADLQAAGRFIASNPTALALNGPAHSVGTFGGRVAFELGAFTYVVVALMSLFMVSRHTRAEEESGRIELLRAGYSGGMPRPPQRCSSSRGRIWCSARSSRPS